MDVWRPSSLPRDLPGIGYWIQEFNLSILTWNVIVCDFYFGFGKGLAKQSGKSLKYDKLCCVCRI